LTWFIDPTKGYSPKNAPRGARKFENRAEMRDGGT